MKNWPNICTNRNVINNNLGKNCNPWKYAAHSHTQSNKRVLAIDTAYRSWIVTQEILRSFPMTINYSVHCVALCYVHLIKCVRIDSSTRVSIYANVVQTCAVRKLCTMVCFRSHVQRQLLLFILTVRFAHTIGRETEWPWVCFDGIGRTCNNNKYKIIILFVHNSI